MTIHVMDETNRLLAQLLALAGLIGSTIEYCEIVRRRVALRWAERERIASQAAGLDGLVRVFLAER